MFIFKDIYIDNPNNILESYGFVGLSNLIVEVTAARDWDDTFLEILYVDYGYYVDGKETIIGRSFYSSGKAVLDYGNIRKEYVESTSEGLSVPMFLTLFIYGANNRSLNVLNLYGLDVFSYALPEVERFLVNRDDIEKTKAIFDISLAVSSILSSDNEMNNLRFKRQIKDDNNSWIDIDSEYILVNDKVYLSSLEHSLPYDLERSYQTRIEIMDVFGSKTFSYDTLPTSSIVMTWGRNGAGFGKRWEQGAIDVFGDYWKNGILQPTLYKKKLSDPDPEGMEDGDLLFIYNDQTPFSSTNFPQEFGTGITWGQTGSWPIEYNYWTSMSATSNSIIKSFQTSAFTGNAYPSAMFNGSTAWNDGVMMPYGSLPVTMIIEFNGSVQFDSFTIWGWAQGHEIKNSPKSFAFFGSNDGHTWISLYDTTTFADSYNTSVSANMSNTGLYFKYLKMVWRTNQDDNSGNLTNASMIAFRELSFVASGSMYV